MLFILFLLLFHISTATPLQYLMRKSTVLEASASAEDLLRVLQDEHNRIDPESNYALNNVPNVHLADDTPFEQIDLPFKFQFYGDRNIQVRNKWNSTSFSNPSELFSAIHVSPNGAIHFDSFSPCKTNFLMKDCDLKSDYRNLITPLLMDFNPGYFPNRDSIKYISTTNMLSVIWINIPLYGFVDELFTFSVSLYSDGSIRINYGNLSEHGNELVLRKRSDLGGLVAGFVAPEILSKELEAEMSQVHKTFREVYDIETPGSYIPISEIKTGNQFEFCRIPDQSPYNGKQINRCVDSIVDVEEIFIFDTNQGELPSLFGCSNQYFPLICIFSHTNTSTPSIHTPAVVQQGGDSVSCMFPDGGSSFQFYNDTAPYNQLNLAYAYPSESQLLQSNVEPSAFELLYPLDVSFNCEPKVPEGTCDQNATLDCRNNCNGDWVVGLQATKEKQYTCCHVDSMDCNGICAGDSALALSPSGNNVCCIPALVDCTGVCSRGCVSTNRPTFPDGLLWDSGSSQIFWSIVTTLGGVFSLLCIGTTMYIFWRGPPDITDEDLGLTSGLSDEEIEQHTTIIEYSGNADELLQMKQPLTIADPQLEEETCIPDPENVEKSNADAVESQAKMVDATFDEEEEELCSICISEFETGDELMFLRCKHIFHAECLKPWFGKSTLCPLCKQDVRGPQYMKKRKPLPPTPAMRHVDIEANTTGVVLMNNDHRHPRIMDNTNENRRRIPRVYALFTHLRRNPLTNNATAPLESTAQRTPNLHEVEENRITSVERNLSSNEHRRNDNSIDIVGNTNEVELRSVDMPDVESMPDDRMLPNCDTLDESDDCKLGVSNNDLPDVLDKFGRTVDDSPIIDTSSIHEKNAKQQNEFSSDNPMFG